MQLNSGDIFCVTSDSLIQSAIKGCNAVASVDGSAEYGHAGIITDPNGGTFEAVDNYSRHNLYERYTGCKVLIGRHVDMDPVGYMSGMAEVTKFAGKRYPWFRLGVYLIPYLPKYVHFGRPVCSELVFMFLSRAGVRWCDYYWGVNPDYVADAIKRWDVFEPIFEGEF